MQFFLLLFVPFFLYGSWAEERIQSMSLEEKIGQLFVIPICPKRGSDHLQGVERVVSEFHIGAVIVKQANPREQVVMLNWLGSKVKDGLLVMQDAEWGLGMRMDETVSFPKNLSLGAVEDDHLIYQMGKYVGEELRMVGAHMNLAPVVDLYSPIMNLRSFGSDPERVARKGIAMMRGLMAGGVIPVAKHFPGHGEVDYDSHAELPTIRNLERGLIPFKRLIDAGVPAIMNGHFRMLLEKKMALLKELGFNGLVLTDALNMKGLTKYYTTEDIAVGHLQSGHDLLLYGDDIIPLVDEILNDTIPRAFKAIRDHVAPEVIHHHALKILQLKEQLGIQQFHPIPMPTSLMRPESLALRRELFRKSITRLPTGEVIAYETCPETEAALREANSDGSSPEGRLPY